MKEMKHFTKIPRVEKFTKLLEDNKEKTIYVMEKLDGSNASFRIHNGELLTFSRRLALSSENTLNGFYNWAHENINSKTLNERYIYFGEWLTKHKIDYKEHLNNFVLFAVYDTENHEYLPFEEVQKISQALNLELVHLFYSGVYQSLEHIEQFVGETAYENVDFGEGIIIFIPDLVFPRDKESQVFLKWVGEEFAEVKKINASKPKVKTLDTLIDSFITQQRMDKILQKLQDEGSIDSELGLQDMGTVLKTLNTGFTEDILDEELDAIIKFLRNYIQKRVPALVKNFIQKEN